MKNLTILCKDFDLTEALKNHAQEKLASLYKFLNKTESEVAFNLRLGKTTNHHNSGKIYYADLSIHTAEKNFGGKVESDDIYAAIDILKDDMAENISHYKGKSHTLEIKDARKFKEALLVTE